MQKVRKTASSRWFFCKRSISQAKGAGKASPRFPNRQLLPRLFPVQKLRRVYATALGHDVDPTNLQRILTRRGMLEPTGSTAAPGPSGGRPAAMYRFTIGELRVTDPFAAFRPRHEPAEPRQETS